MRHARRKHRDLRMVQIDYKKAYDSAPHSWFLKSLDLIGAADNENNFLHGKSNQNMEDNPHY